MATLNFWHKLHLHRPQITRGILLAALALAGVPAAWGQGKLSGEIRRGKGGAVKSITVKNLPAYDDRWFHPGMYVAITASRFVIEQST